VVCSHTTVVVGPTGVLMPSVALLGEQRHPESGAGFNARYVKPFVHQAGSQIRGRGQLHPGTGFGRRLTFRNLHRSSSQAQ
jgi:hypothetical protein